jgi:SAM-dependent methyltransferase
MPPILNGVTAAWADEDGVQKRVLDMSVGRGETSKMLAAKHFTTIATEYYQVAFLGNDIACVGGVNLNLPLPFKSAAVDGVNLTEVIEHIENQAQLIREISRVLKVGGVVVISTPNVLNVVSRLRFLFTGFVRGRVRPAHYTKSHGGQAPNIYMIGLYELYYLLFHSGLEIVGLYKTKVKFASWFFLPLVFPWMCILSFFGVIHAEKDPVQRRYNWQILKHLFHPAALLSDNIVVKARKVSVPRVLPKVQY